MILAAAKARAVAVFESITHLFVAYVLKVTKNVRALHAALLGRVNYGVAMI